jgi:HEAT repeats/HEAT repeat
MVYNDDEQPAVNDAEKQQRSMHAAVPASLLPSVLGRLGLEDLPEAQVYATGAFLRNEKRNRRVLAVRRLGEDREAASLGVLTAALHDHEWEVRAAAVWALGAFDEQAPLQALFASLTDEDGSVRIAALRTVCRMNAGAALDAALRLLHDDEWQVRESAISTLGELGEQAPLEPLMAGLQDENVFVRRAAQMVLEQSLPTALSMPHSAHGTPLGEQHVDREPGSPLRSQHSDGMQRRSMFQLACFANLYRSQQQKKPIDRQEETQIPCEEWPDASLPEHEMPRPAPRRSRLMHFFNGIAAVLMAGLLIGSALLLFAPGHEVVPGAPPQASTGSAQTDIPFTPLSRLCFASAESSCAHSPFTQLHLSGTIAGFTLVIKQAYADANRVLIRYSVTRNADHQFVFARPLGSATIQQDPAFHESLGVDGGDGSYDPKTKVGIQGMGLSFDASNMPPAHASALSLHLVIEGFEMIIDPSAKTHPHSGHFQPLLGQPISFDFSVPFHSGQVVILHRTLTVAGTSMTLERMVATPSQTRFVVAGKNITMEFGFSLTDNGRRVENMGAGLGGSVDQTGKLYSGTQLASVDLDFDPVFESNAVCTFTITAPTDRHTGPWVFHFVVP